MCGIVGLVSKSLVNQTIFDALTVLQHRGQDAAGMVTCEGNQFFLRKDNGLVNEVFRTRHMKKLLGNIGIGHVRYPTAGSSSAAEAQPFYVNAPYGIALAHNGNLTNTDELAQEMRRVDLRHINTTSDSEILVNILAHELQNLGKLVPTPVDIFTAVAKVHKRIRGGYAVVAVITGFGVLAFRDAYGVRPLVYGLRQTDNGQEAMVASESVALDIAGFKLERDVAPGEAIFIDLEGNVHSQQCAENAQLAPCLFEQVYFARPDSIIDGVNVHKARMRMGIKLAERVKAERPDHDIDVVIPIPDTSRTSALEMAEQLGVTFREGFIKNRYIGRTFIMPGQVERKKSVRRKLNPIESEFRGKVVMLVDDSIVRGTTSKQIVQMVREVGAKKVYFASAAPPVRYPNVYGIDMPSPSEFIAHNRTEDEIGQAIGVDWMLYQKLDDLKEAVAGDQQFSSFETSVFDGKYVTGDISEEYLQRIDAKRNDSTKEDDEELEAGENAPADLHDKIH
ncbi:MAG: amidophosphoribosyltransferase [Pseudomonadales bacterium]|nr:amidophosphoribosyltransferase [Pseudomonadales bacterium]NRA17803.1 amidophosphoribosyltransferase [Oceanospirillaceae bacterium]